MEPMRPIGSPTPSAVPEASSRTTLWGTVIGLAVLVVIFVVALLQAANANTWLGWVLAGIALGWLLLAGWVVLMVRRAARFGRRQVEEAQAQLRGRAPAAARSGAADSMRDEKLSHSFQIVLVQSKVIKQELAALPTEGVDREALDRALETIDITAGNGMSMLRDEPLSGPVVD
jgi:type VI protein secretion system component VasK